MLEIQLTQISCRRTDGVLERLSELYVKTIFKSSVVETWLESSKIE
jgi:hypothetical protein